jgi:hypothetical protein
VLDAKERATEAHLKLSNLLNDIRNGKDRLEMDIGEDTIERQLWNILDEHSGDCHLAVDRWKPIIIDCEVRFLSRRENV